MGIKEQVRIRALQARRNRPTNLVFTAFQWTFTFIASLIGVAFFYVILVITLSLGPQ